MGKIEFWAESLKVTLIVTGIQYFYLNSQCRGWQYNTTNGRDKKMAQRQTWREKYGDRGKQLKKTERTMSQGGPMKINMGQKYHILGTRVKIVQRVAPCGSTRICENPANWPEGKNPSRYVIKKKQKYLKVSLGFGLLYISSMTPARCYNTLFIFFQSTGINPDETSNVRCTRRWPNQPYLIPVWEYPLSTI